MLRLSRPLLELLAEKIWSQIYPFFSVFPQFRDREPVKDHGSSIFLRPNDALCLLVEVGVGRKFDLKIENIINADATSGGTKVTILIPEA